MAQQSPAEIQALIRESLGLQPKQEAVETFPVEGHLCDFPTWSYSKKRSSIKRLQINYEDGSYFVLDAPKGMPGPSFAGYLDVLLYYGQRDLFVQDHVEMSAYAILQKLGISTEHGSSYENFYRDMVKAFAVVMESDRFIDPITKTRSHRKFFRILDTMDIAKSRRSVSRFTFHKVFLESFRSGYLKRLDLDYCLDLDRKNKPLARFLYSHVTKRLGDKSIYTRNRLGFVSDIGLQHWLETPGKVRERNIRQVLYPALDEVKGHGFAAWHTDDHANLVFVP
jgi:hypothetical protein